MGGASRLLMLLATPFPRPSALRLARHSGTSLAALSSPAASSSRCRRLVLPFSSHLRLGFSTVASEQIYPPAGGAREGFGEAVVSAPTFHAAGAAHPWPEWTKLVEYLSSGGYFGRQSTVSAGEDDDDDSFLAGYDLTEEFVKAAQACLCFARHRPDILRLLAKKDIEIIVGNGSPFLFKNGSISTRRLLWFLSADGANDPETLTVDVLFELDANPLKVLDSKSAQTVDVMRYLLSYSYSSHGTSDEAYGSRDLIDTSIRNLLAELVRLSVATPEARLTEPNARQTVVKHVQFSRPTGQNIEMKRGDWICQRCSFMNFARNMKCLECNEARPKGVFPGGEWECPQCDFFNYWRNMTCLRCDCKRPGEGPLGADPSAGSGHNRSLNIDSVIERKLAENDEKAERWFSKISQLNDAADFNSAINDEDFPEIMPMQKGMNRFVVSTRKTPLERRLANSQNNNLLANSSPEGNQLQSGGSTGMVSHKNSDPLISQTLDRILRRSSEPTEMNNLVTAGGGNSGPGNRSIFSDYRDEMVNKDPDYAPFVPLPAEMFGKPCNTNNERTTDIEVSASMKSGHPGESMLNGSEGSNESKDKELSNASPSWSKKVSELDNALNQVNATSDDIPEVMPMRKGENRFVISKKKDCSLTSPQHKRWVAMQQANSSNFVPFVPFPPGYFTKEDKQAEASLLVASASKGSTLNEKARSVTEESEEAGVSGLRFHGNTRMPDNWPVNYSNHKTSTTDSYKIDSSNHETDDSCNGASANSAQLQKYSFSNLSKTSNSSYSQYKPRNGPSISSTTERTEMSKSSNEGWKPSFSGKSLEGSAVTEPDPLDMSQEAKAARWFRRAAQIKDISELSNIPDEDFPEIMPMRKGINRFVVSKRKTPLERRLTSPQYRRNLPIISSESEKDTNK